MRKVNIIKAVQQISCVNTKEQMGQPKGLGRLLERKASYFLFHNEFAGNTKIQN